MPRMSLPLAAVALIGLSLTSCLNLKRVSDPMRFYVLSPIPGTAQAAGGGGDDLAVGVGPVEIPAYLMDRRMVVRHGGHEVSYSEYDRWAERLDKGIQRVVAANLASLLPSNRVSVSAWQRSDVAAEVYISVLRFETDDQGRVVLEARWRITSPGGETTWQSGHSSFTRPGPNLRANPDAGVGELSQALAELCQPISEALQRAVRR
jgi:uncharacterized lipoprotein YmbA